MNKDQIKIVGRAKKVVRGILENEVLTNFSFHNMAHTQDVAKSAGVIEGHYLLNDDDRFIVFIAAWFHDTGFSAGCAKGHEDGSIKLAADFLREHDMGPEVIERVSACIQATCVPQVPLSLVEKIICDADLYHLGTNKFETWSARLRQELKICSNCDNTDQEWRQADIDLLISHSYHTGFCQQKLQHVKQGWIAELQNRQSSDPLYEIKTPVLQLTATLERAIKISSL